MAKNHQKVQSGRCTMKLALYIESKHHSTTTTFSRNSWLYWLFLLIRKIVYLPPIQLNGGSCTIFPFLHEKEGNIVQPPLFHLNKPQETIRLRLSVILGLVELIRWPHMLPETASRSQVLLSG